MQFTQTVKKPTLDRPPEVTTSCPSKTVCELRVWIATNAAATWVRGKSLSPAELVEGFNLVRTICTESPQLHDTANQCYTLYLDYCRGICGQFGDGKERRSALSALKLIFLYLDWHFCNTENVPEMERTKQPTSLKLCAGQDLQKSAAAIENDALWIPDYQAAPAPAAALAPAGNELPAKKQFLDVDVEFSEVYGFKPEPDFSGRFCSLSPSEREITATVVVPATKRFIAAEISAVCRKSTLTNYARHRLLAVLQERANCVTQPAEPEQVPNTEKNPEKP